MKLFICPNAEYVMTHVFSSATLLNSAAVDDYICRLLRAFDDKGYKCELGSPNFYDWEGHQWARCSYGVATGEWVIDATWSKVEDICRSIRDDVINDWAELQDNSKISGKKLTNLP